MAALGKNWRIELRSASGVGAACCAGQGLFLSELHAGTDEDYRVKRHEEGKNRNSIS